MNSIEAVQRRTMRTLVLSQAGGALGFTIGLAAASLLAKEIAGSDTVAGLAQTAQVVGAAAAAQLLARVMTRFGRRVGLSVGYLLGAVGSALAVLAGVIDSLAVLMVGAVLLGSTTAAGYAARYAATDLAAEDRRARSLSIVVWATTIGAVLGPNLTGPGAALADRLGLVELTGPFALGAVGMLVAALIAFVGLRPDPLLLARQRDAAESMPAGAVGAAGARSPQSSSSARPLRAVLADQPLLVAAIVGLAAAHAVMVGVMVMTPLHMEHGGAGLRIIGIVISIHVLGMFAFAPLVGWACDRFGRPGVLAAGGVTLLVSLALCAASPAGHSDQLMAGLFLLGLGWSLATVAASTLIAELAPVTEATSVQGFADTAMNLAAAAAGALSGVIVALASFAVLSGFAALVAGVVLLVAGRSARVLAAS